MTPSHNPSPYRFFGKSSNTSSSQTPKALQTPSHSSVRPVAPVSTATRTQFAPTPRFASTPSVRGPSRYGRENAIEDFESSSPSQHEPPRLRFSSSANVKADELDDDSENDSVGMVDLPDVPEDEFDDLLDVFESRQRKARVNQERLDIPDAATTSHARKRRKIASHKKDDTIYISSSPSAGDSPPLSPASNQSENIPQDVSLDEDLVHTSIEEPMIYRGHDEPPSTSTKGAANRFKHVTEVTPFSPPSIPNKSVFLRPQLPSRTNSSSLEVPNLLPDALSPSKRRGRKEYLSHGMAETMVDWVLTMGQEEEARIRQLRQHQVTRPEQRPIYNYERIFHVVEVTRDDDNRGLLVRGHDENIYLLTSITSNVGSGGDAGKVVIGSRIGLRQGNLSWMADLREHDDDVLNETSKMQGRLIVSALWDLDPR